MIVKVSSVGSPKRPNMGSMYESSPEESPFHPSLLVAWRREFFNFSLLLGVISSLEALESARCCPAMEVIICIFFLRLLFPPPEIETPSL